MQGLTRALLPDFFRPDDAAPPEPAAEDVVEELPPPPEVPGPLLIRPPPASLRLPPAQMQREVCLHVVSCISRGWNS